MQKAGSAKSNADRKSILPFYVFREDSRERGATGKGGVGGLSDRNDRISSQHRRCNPLCCRQQDEIPEVSSFLFGSPSFLRLRHPREHGNDHEYSEREHAAAALPEDVLGRQVPVLGTLHWMWHSEGVSTWCIPCRSRVVNGVCRIALTRSVFGVFGQEYLSGFSVSRILSNSS